MAAVIWSFSMIINKIVMEKYFSKPIIPALFSILIGVGFFFGIWLFKGLVLLPLRILVLALIIGIIGVGQIWCFFKAIRLDEVSRVAPLLAIGPMFTLVVAMIFLGEVFTLARYIGLFLLIIGTVLISIRNFKLRFGRAFKFIMMNLILSAFSAVIYKYVLGYTNFWNAFAYARFGAFIAAVPLFLIYRKALVAALKTKNKKPLVIWAASEGAAFVGGLLWTVSAAIGFVTLVQALGNLQVVFVLIFASVLSMFFPKLLKEELTKGIFVQKLVAVILIFVGVVLIV